MCKDILKILILQQFNTPAEYNRLFYQDYIVKLPSLAFLCLFIPETDKDHPSWAFLNGSFRGRHK